MSSLYISTHCQLLLADWLRCVVVTLTLAAHTAPHAVVLQHVLVPLHLDVLALVPLAPRPPANLSGGDPGRARVGHSHRHRTDTERPRGRVLASEPLWRDPRMAGGGRGRGLGPRRPHLLRHELLDDPEAREEEAVLVHVLDPPLRPLEALQSLHSPVGKLRGVNLLQLGQDEGRLVV